MRGRGLAGEEIPGGWPREPNRALRGDRGIWLEQHATAESTGQPSAARGSRGLGLGLVLGGPVTRDIAAYSLPGIPMNY